MEMLTRVGGLPREGVGVGAGVGVATTVGCVGWDGASLPHETAKSAGSRASVSF
jgi:hypothetical protein